MLNWKMAHHDYYSIQYVRLFDSVEYMIAKGFPVLNWYLKTITFIVQSDIFKPTFL